jgi:alginate O-acetyltransferase complex protein AlgI
MLFSGIPFLFYFLPVVLILYFLAPNKLKNTVLLLCSLLFYAWGEPKYVFLMIASILLYYGFGLGIDCTKYKKVFLTASILTGIVMLGVFKYADFFIDTVNSLTGASMSFLKLALPIGISFYTFQCISYTIDVYRGHTAAQRNIIDFGTYVALFPQLIAGPIVRYVDVAKELRQRKNGWDQIVAGLPRFLVGLGKKVLLANQFGLLVEQFRNAASPSVLFYWMYAIAFTLHIYFDFSGYSDMAIGLGRIFGFHFPENFDYPYISGSITEFWRRWHMTLGGWFRDYVYIPLGGNRVSRGRWVVNILIVWMLTGLWHGAAWNFVLWGLLYAFMLLLEKWLPALKRLPATLRHGYVLLTVVLGFVLFNATDIAQAGQDFAGLFGLTDHPIATPETLYYLRSYALLFVIGILGATPLLKFLRLRLAQSPLTEGCLTVAEPVALAILLLVCTAYLVDGSFNPFLYFRF